jgi:S-formylglutathione hydrolase FrmB
MKRFLGLLLTLTLLCSVTKFASAWGGEGHSLTAHLAIRSLPSGNLKGFYAQNAAWFARNSSHPDRWRNRVDHAEAGRHFLDGERFGFGSDLKRLPSNFGELLKLRTYAQLREDGIVPWAVGNRYKLLVSALKERRWPDAMVQSAYMSHYVADSHVPFHATDNYDGQLSNPSQKGIHARFESDMVERSILLEELKVGTPTVTTDGVSLTLTVLNDSIAQVPNILEIDKNIVATLGADFKYTDASYLTSFVTGARPIAIARLEAGGRDLSGLLVAAWKEAGSPKLPTSFEMSDVWLPYAPEFVQRPNTSQAMPTVFDSAKVGARRRAVTLQVPSKLYKQTIPVNILLPYGYESGNKRYSTLYLLHGATGKYSDWNNTSGVAAYAKEVPMIIVMPDGMKDAWYQDSTGKGPWESFFRTELIPYIDTHYHTIANREGRALAGLSMGGYGAWRLGLDMPTLFSCAASLSGAIGWGEGEMNPGLMGYAKALYGESPEAGYKAAALWPRAEKLVDAKGNWSGPALYFDCGKDDFLNASNRDFEAKLLTKGIPYEFAEFDGAHTWEYWDTHIRDVFNFTLRHVSQPK